MKTPVTLPPVSHPLPCIEGNATLFPGRLGALVLTGKRKRPDSLFWSLLGTDTRRGPEMTVSIQGLYRGRYADAVATAQTLFEGLHAIGDAEEAEKLARACAANDVTLTIGAPV